jgi:hypothetical protein
MLTLTTTSSVDRMQTLTVQCMALMRSREFHVPYAATPVQAAQE